MNKELDFDLKNLGEDYFYTYPVSEKPKRSIKKKLAIVVSFVGILALLPVSLAIYSNQKPNQREAVSVAPKSFEFENKKTVNQNTLTTDQPQTQTMEVRNNDSYWKITKRVCGTGKTYLLVRDQNNGKALYKGDFVTVNCSLQ